MQQQGGRTSQYGQELTPFAAASVTTDHRTHLRGGISTEQQLKSGDPSLGAEAASPISSRPPAVVHFSPAGNFEELLQVAKGGGSSAGFPDEDAHGGDEADRGVGGCNRWPRQETLALLKIRSDMDATFRDVTLKAPLWEDISRKLAELGYKRNAKKCKEKFENVHKYYKRTKEGRGGRQDGKSYRFFSQLEALHSTVVSVPTLPTTPTSTTMVAAASTTTTAATNDQVVSPVAVPVPISTETGIANPMPLTTIGISTPFLVTPSESRPLGIGAGAGAAPAVLLFGSATEVAAPKSAAMGISFSSDSSSSYSEEMEDEGEDEMLVEGDLNVETDNAYINRKRKRGSSKQRISTSGSQRMMEFFENLMKQVMQKQETMQQRFLEVIEKREQDRMIKEEAWKRQEMARLAREHNLMAQERAMSSSRDAAIIAFLQKITGQTIQFPPVVTIHVPPPPSPPPSSSQQYQKPQQQPDVQHYPQNPQSHKQQQYQQQGLHQQRTQGAEAGKHQPPISSELDVVIHEQVTPQEVCTGGGSFEATSSRWPKSEVLALIKMRSGLESRYQEAGPKGPLWEEISLGMQRMGYRRNAKRCKEKWENINKYFKKVKESNKQRPEDAKTCPYFHQLDALYQKKILGSNSSSIGISQIRTGHQPQEESMTMDPKIQQRSDAPLVMDRSPQITQISGSENKGGGNTDMQASYGGLSTSVLREGSEGGAGGAKKPEDIVKEQQQRKHEQLLTDDFDKIEKSESDYLDQEDDEEDEDEEAEDQMKLVYKLQFQRQNTSSSNGGGNGATSFLAMVQ